jgi:hypothetical protein
MFSARGFEDDVFLVAMALLLDAYMQWFHIGSYRLAVLFSQWGGLVHTTGKHLPVATFRISNLWFMYQGTSLGHGISVLADSRESLLTARSGQSPNLDLSPR